MQLRYLLLALSLLAAALVGLLAGAGAADLAARDEPPEEHVSLLDQYAAAAGRPAWAPLEFTWGQRGLDAALWAALSGPVPGERTRAALAFGLTGGDGSRSRLAALLRDPAAEVRRFAAIALCYLGDARGEAGARLALLKGEPWVRQLALVGLWRLDSPETRDFLRGVTAEQPPVLQELTVQALRSAPWRPPQPLASVLETAIQGGPEQAWEYLADSLVLASDYWWHQGQYDRVCHVLEGALFFSPQRPDLYGDIAWLQWSMGRDGEAVATLKRGLAANPGNWEAYFNLGFHYFNTRRYAEALPYLEYAAENTPTWPVPTHVHAHALEALGRPQEALQAWEAALRRFPEDEPARRNRERVQRALAAPAE